MYVCSPPAHDPDVSDMKKWCIPSQTEAAQKQTTALPEFQDVVDYLSAFYHDHSF